MCNPNALVYQQMITSPNAYWLHFFLRREINVVCWNYRGYGESEQGLCNWLGPNDCKRDVERVFAFMVNSLRLTGNFGAYGRSIGGVAACHLSAVYKDMITVLIIDRSLCELRGIGIQKLGKCGTDILFDFLTTQWRALSDLNFVKADNCFKIVTCDPLDDTVD